MTNVLLYWNHICVLHNQEQAFLPRLAETLKADDIASNVRYFALRYPPHINASLALADSAPLHLLSHADLQ